MARFMLLLLAISGLGVALSPSGARGNEACCTEVDRFSAREAVQGVAVDGEHFYAIANSAIAKYDRNTGGLVARWAGSEELPLKHLNAGVVRAGRLYCAHSNFPDYPPTSSVEVFDCATLQHIESHSFGIYEGSLTAVDWYEGRWWCVFAHYSKKVNDDPHARPHSHTSLVQFDEAWRRTAGWVFPPQVLDRLAPHSCSGAVWGSDGTLYCSGHDRPEIYRLALPRSGSTLRLVETLKVPFPGQGIAWERPATLEATRGGRLWGIVRPNAEVVSVQLPGELREAPVAAR